MAAVLLMVRTYLQDTVTPIVLETNNALGFFQEILDTNADDLARNFEMWATDDKGELTGGRT